MTSGKRDSKKASVASDQPPEEESNSTSATDDSQPGRRPREPSRRVEVTRDATQRPGHLVDDADILREAKRKVQYPQGRRKTGEGLVPDPMPGGSHHSARGLHNKKQPATNGTAASVPGAVAVAPVDTSTAASRMRQHRQQQELSKSGKAVPEVCKSVGSSAGCQGPRSPKHHHVSTTMSPTSQVDHRKNRILAYSDGGFSTSESSEIGDVEALPLTPNLNLPARPGAYNGMPGLDYERLSSLRVGMGSNYATSEEESKSEDFVEHSPLPHILENGGEIAAVRVDEDELELNIREQIANDAAQAEVVDVHQEKQEMKARMQRRYIALLIVLVAVIIAVVITVVTQTSGGGGTVTVVANDTDDEPFAPPTTLQSVTKKARVSCGVTKRDDNVQMHPEYYNSLMGFQGDICKGVAAASLGGEPNIEIHDLTEPERWDALANGTVDMLIIGTPPSTGTQYFDLDSEVPVTFTNPFFFDGVGVGGLPVYVNPCAKPEGLRSVGKKCQHIKVCVVLGSSALDILEEILHPSQLVKVSFLQDVYNSFSEGCCNMIATDWADERAQVAVRAASGYDGPYALGEALLSRQPYAIASRKQAHKSVASGGGNLPKEEDPQVWSEFLNWVLQALIAAEQQNITQTASELLPSAQVFGQRYKNAFQHAVKAVGHYGELYERNMGHVIPRDGMNMINDGSTGLHYFQAIADIDEYGTPVENGTLQRVKERGKLVCGVPRMDGEALAATSGSQNVSSIAAALIDVEYCRALAYSIFQSLSLPNETSSVCLAHADRDNSTKTAPFERRIEFVPLSNTGEGYSKLNAGEVDVIAGYRMTLQSDVHEPTTGKGYSFTQPYFYGAMQEGDHVTSNNRCIVTRQDDTQFTDYVHLVVMSIFYAEENGITQQKANTMPIVNLFGTENKRMLRDAVFAIGSFAELHARLGNNQTGPNSLNFGGTPQLCAMPGLHLW